MRIQNNIAALNTHRWLGINQAMANRALEKLSSGFRINRAADDAAGLAVSEKMRAQIRGLEQAARNAQDGVSLIQTAEGGTQEIHSMLQRMRELAVQSATETLTSEDRTLLNEEFKQLSQEITRIASEKEFNAQKLLDGSATGITIQVGPNTGQTINFAIADLTATGLGVETTGTGALDIGTVTGANAAIATLDTAITTVSTERAKLGAVQNRLEYTLTDLGITAENLTAAESRIRDADMALEMMQFTKYNILAQSSIAMLAQANLQPQNVLQLLA
jgi:flagellin